ncbi:L,D-transpeptidase [Paenibacillus filicis]|uniref:L,D-transpeptidase n=1 Tax=Paenibacillus filicis TaxID=669464 RepID=A0ABU9DDP3_9BACL
MQSTRSRFPSPSANQLVRLRKNLYVNRHDPLYHQKVIRYLDPHSPEAHFRLAQHYEQRELPNKALLHYKQAMHTYPSEYYYPASAAIRRLEQPEKPLEAGSSVPIDEYYDTNRINKAFPLFLKVLLLTLLLINALLLLLFFTPPASVSKVITFLKPWSAVGKSVTYESQERPFVLHLPYGRSDLQVEEALHKKALTLAEAYPDSSIVLYGVSSPAADEDLKAVPLPDESWKDRAFVVAEYNPAVDRAVKIRFLHPDLFKSRNQAAANLVRTALVAYQQAYGQAPASISDLLGDYPHNYLSTLPSEAGTGSDVVRTFFDGSGGWVYERSAQSPELMFYPNTAAYGPGAVQEKQTSALLPFQPVRLHVNRSEHTVELRSGELIMARYPIGVGADGATPSGTYHVSQRVREPQGRTPDVYGSAALGLGEIALHGTSDETSVGGNVSLGCIRLNNRDMEALFPLVPIGTEVVIGDGSGADSGASVASRLSPNTSRSAGDPGVAARPLSGSTVLEGSSGRKAETAIGDLLFLANPSQPEEKQREKAPGGTVFHWLG